MCFLGGGGWSARCQLTRTSPQNSKRFKVPPRLTEPRSQHDASPDPTQPGSLILPQATGKTDSDLAPMGPGGRCKDAPASIAAQGQPAHLAPGRRFGAEPAGGRGWSAQTRKQSLRKEKPTCCCFLGEASPSLPASHGECVWGWAGRGRDACRGGASCLSRVLTDREAAAAEQILRNPRDAEGMCGTDDLGRRDQATPTQPRAPGLLFTPTSGPTRAHCQPQDVAGRGHSGANRSDARKRRNPRASHEAQGRL